MVFSSTPTEIKESEKYGCYSCREVKIFHGYAGDPEYHSRNSCHGRGWEGRCLRYGNCGSRHRRG